MSTPVVSSSPLYLKKPNLAAADQTKVIFLTYSFFDGRTGDSCDEQASP